MFGFHVGIVWPWVLRTGWGQWNNALVLQGGYILPSRAALLFASVNAKIKGFRECTVVGCDVRVVPLLSFATRVAGMGVAASAGAVNHVTVLSYLEGVLLGRSVWLLQVSQWAGLQAPSIGTRGRTVVCFGRIGIPYKCPVFTGRDSLDSKPVTGSLHFGTP